MIKRPNALGLFSRICFGRLKRMSRAKQFGVSLFLHFFQRRDFDSCVTNLCTLLLSRILVYVAQADCFPSFFCLCNAPDNLSLYPLSGQSIVIDHTKVMSVWELSEALFWVGDHGTALLGQSKSNLRVDKDFVPSCKKLIRVASKLLCHLTVRAVVSKGN